jgi:hypothetical protein
VASSQHNPSIYLTRPRKTNATPPPFPARIACVMAKIQIRNLPKISLKLYHYTNVFQDCVFHKRTHPESGPDFKLLLPVQTPVQVLRTFQTNLKIKRKLSPAVFSY